MENYPAKFYAAEKGKPLHIIGYTLALASMATGVLEIGHGIYYGLKGEGSTMGYALGPAILIGSGITAYSYLKYAGVVY